METNQEIYQQNAGGGYLEPHRGTLVLVFGIL